MPRQTRIRLIMGVIVLFGGVAFSFGGGVVLIMMALKSLDPNNTSNVTGAVVWLDRAFQITEIGMAVTAIALVFTLIALVGSFVGRAKPARQTLSDKH